MKGMIIFLKDFKIGVIADSFKAGFAEGVKKAAKLGFNGIQVYTVSGEMSAEELTDDKIKAAKSMLKDYNIEISAVCGDLGGHGFTRKDENPYKIERSKRIVDLALKLGTDIVTSHIGVINADKSSEERKIQAEACEELGEYAERAGVRFAVETGPEKAKTLKDFIDSLHTNGIRVNLDPANLKMVTDDDPVQAVYTLKDYIIHTHVKDGVMIKKTDPKVIYDFFAEGGIGDLRIGDYFSETPLGQGSVDFKAYFKALKDIGYHGYLTIEREVGDHPEEDIKTGLDYIKKIL